mmetsp:Transcript_6079/g.12674  ORF Transcript_6079/g.12674 Transcript_6079/m.12674 type:complete len:243 (-) Transcript_6079:496-1224(-)
MFLQFFQSIRLFSFVKPIHGIFLFLVPLVLFFLFFQTPHGPVVIPPIPPTPKRKPQTHHLPGPHPDVLLPQHLHLPQSPIHPHALLQRPQPRIHPLQRVQQLRLQQHLQLRPKLPQHRLPVLPSLGHAPQGARAGFEAREGLRGLDEFGGLGGQEGGEGGERLVPGGGGGEDGAGGREVGAEGVEGGEDGEGGGLGDLEGVLGGGGEGGVEGFEAGGGMLWRGLLLGFGRPSGGGVPVQVTS